MSLITPTEAGTVSKIRRRRAGSLKGCAEQLLGFKTTERVMKWGKSRLECLTSSPPPPETSPGTAGYLFVPPASTQTWSLKQLEPQQMQRHVLRVGGEERSRRRGGETAGDTFTTSLLK